MEVRLSTFEKVQIIGKTYKFLNHTAYPDAKNSIER